MHTIPPNICSLDIPKTSLTIEGNTGHLTENYHFFANRQCLGNILLLLLILPVDTESKSFPRHSAWSVLNGSGKLRCNLYSVSSIGLF